MTKILGYRSLKTPEDVFKRVCDFRWRITYVLDQNFEPTFKGDYRKGDEFYLDCDESGRLVRFRWARKVMRGSPLPKPYYLSCPSGEQCDKFIERQSIDFDSGAKELELMFNCLIRENGVLVPHEMKMYFNFSGNKIDFEFSNDEIDGVIGSHGSGGGIGT